MMDCFLACPGSNVRIPLYHDGDYDGSDYGDDDGDYDDVVA